MRLNGAGNDVFAKIGVGVFEQFDQNIPVENVDSHGSKIELLVTGDAKPGIPFLFQPQRVKSGRVPGFFDEGSDAALRVDLHDPE